MTLGEFIAKLEAVPDKTRVCAPGLGNPHSWRGAYESLAFQPVAWTTVQAMLDAAKQAVGANYHGYKGGLYVMQRRTQIHIEDPGRWTDGGEARRFIAQYDSKMRLGSPGRPEEESEESLVATAVDLMLEDVAMRLPLPPG